MKTVNPIPMSARASVVMLNFSEEELEQARLTDLTDRYTALDIFDLVAKFLQENHPEVLELRNTTGINLSAGFDITTNPLGDLIQVLVSFSPNRFLKNQKEAEAHIECPCGWFSSYTVKSFVDNLTGEVSVGLSLQTFCSHRFATRMRNNPKVENPKPASKKRRKRDARKQAA